MTGRAAIIGKEVAIQTLKQVVEEITFNFKEIDLVLYDITGKPPATVEWE
jgi:GMP synthase PP-ATPase subunit